MFNKARVHFFLLWFLIVSVCIYLGILVSVPLQHFLYELYYGMAYSPLNTDAFFEGILALLVAVGLLMGLGQWVVINTKIKAAHGWILATFLGFSGGSFLFFFIFSPISLFADKSYRVIEWIHMTGTFLGAGMFTGFCQWISLRRKPADSLKWSLVMALSYVGGMVMLMLFGSVSSKAGPILFSITIGLISGVFVERLIISSETQNMHPQEIAS